MEIHQLYPKIYSYTFQQMFTEHLLFTYQL